MTTTISNQDDVIESRDLEARIEELESLMPDEDTDSKVTGFVGDMSLDKARAAINKATGE